MSNNFSIFDVCPQRITSINKPICYLEDLGYVINSQIILKCNFDSKVDLFSNKRVLYAV